jgi:hypothetical protein
MIFILRSGILPGIMGLCLLAISARIFLTKRPFLFPARWFAAIVMLALSPLISFIIEMISDKIDRDYIDWSGMSTPLLLAGMFIAILIFLFIQSNGYMAIGATEESIRSALHGALERLNLPFQESLSRFQLTTIGVDLQASMRDWLGTANIQINKRRHRSTLQSIAKAINEQFASVPGNLNRRGVVFYGVMGALQVVLAISMFTLNIARHSLSNEYIEVDKYLEPEKIVGKLGWVIREAATGKILDEGAKDLRVKDILVKKSIVKKLPYEDRLHFHQSIRLNKGFYLARLVYPQADRSIFKGFGLRMEHRTRPTVCYESFNIDGEHHATKSEGAGEMAFAIGQINSNWEITRTEFLSDVAFRMNLLEDPEVQENYPKWRVTILKGSYVNWPSVIGDTVVPNY